MSRALHSARYDAFRALLVGRRKRAGLTQAAVAERLGRPQSYVAMYEGGERRLDLVEFMEVAAAIKFDPESFVRALKKRIGEAGSD